jgi:hypothetical protein
MASRRTIARSARLVTSPDRNATLQFSNEGMYLGIAPMICSNASLHWAETSLLCSNASMFRGIASLHSLKTSLHSSNAGMHCTKTSLHWSYASLHCPDAYLFRLRHPDIHDSHDVRVTIVSRT